MRTVLIILGGLVLWVLCLLAAKLLSSASPAALSAATALFVGAWIVVAAVNMWFGVYRAGYSFQDELPIFLVIALLPTAVAVVARWKFL
jgi:hypothetical protein